MYKLKVALRGLVRINLPTPKKMIVKLCLMTVAAAWLHHQEIALVKAMRSSSVKDFSVVTIGETGVESFHCKMWTHLECAWAEKNVYMCDYCK